jgi:hypothetical protein
MISNSQARLARTLTKRMPDPLRHSLRNAPALCLEVSTGSGSDRVGESFALGTDSN